MPSCRLATTRISGWIDRIGGRLALAGIAVMMLGSVGLMTAGEPVPDTAVKPDQVAGFMRAKLTHSSAVLEGLSLEDYDLIKTGAQQLSLVSQEAGWQVLQTAEYARQSIEFRRACDGLERAAKDENLDAAVLAWMDVTLKCVQCHRYVRDEERADAAP